MNEPVHFLGAADIRRLASEHGIRPTKAWGQNFVIDANTVRRIVRLAEVTPEDVVLEVGPGLGSLTLGLLESAGRVLVIEIDPVLAAALPATVAGAAGDRSARLGVIPGDALKVTALPAAPTKLVANLPYNISVPVVLHLLEAFPSIDRVLVMVQLEVAQRLAAPPGSRTYGAPSAKAAWFGTVRLAGTVGRTIFWPVPKVDSGLVAIERGQPPRTDIGRREVFAVVDAAFAQRRKMLRSALAGWAGSPAAASSILTAAGVDPTTRGEHLGIAAFADIAAARCAYADPEPPRPRPGPGDF
ncbi:16S rRNA (adenine(1518)-N(6)/adenine(1519)-N(6))-dimethyltransferase RsmA [Nostocoides sp.]|uniref:16S rRNA (adenine(1518)-N(6)/adenine(1519)-N(6))- dimethyltransferase RsmA n=1 Tax=Nostocoides sp. TaxID=1917966 RepID=UPI002CF8E0DF|nr:16S rRNA (adenine(1518)-N(6)/adenine(1519)-N(6))-dimethyltransferase RsmA [Tetrasphaera sp.]